MYKRCWHKRHRSSTETKPLPASGEALKVSLQSSWQLGASMASTTGWASLLAFRCASPSSSGLKATGPRGTKRGQRGAHSAERGHGALGPRRQTQIQEGFGRHRTGSLLLGASRGMSPAKFESPWLRPPCSRKTGEVAWKLQSRTNGMEMERTPVQSMTTL